MSNINIVKSDLDERQYKHIILPNKMDVLLVHDKDTDMAAASMAVNAGFYVDPPNTQGLAHFLEHMLFMGTHKHPKEDQYPTFIGRNGGYDNAYTYYEETVFYFNIQANAFEEALDMFSRYFIDPLLSESSISREMNAVNSEHLKNINNDGWRESRIISELSNDSYPLHKFGTGNLETLSKSDIREQLITFYKKYYSANTMKLIVYGPQNIDQLENMVRQMFQEVKNYNYKQISYNFTPFKNNFRNTSHTTNITNIYYCQKLIHIVPIKNIKKFIIHWQIPSTRKYYKISPISYLCHLIGHEGKGSIYYELRNKGWCNSLVAHESHTDNNTSLFSIEMKLTDEGFKNKIVILKILYEYINLVKNKGINKHIYNELKNIEELKFKYRSKGDPVSFVESCASKMLFYPIKDILSVHKLLQPYDSEVENVLQLYVNNLIPLNAIIVFSSQDYKNTTKYNEKWYDIEYNVYNNANINELEDDIVHNYNFNIFLPTPNKFIPFNLQLVNCCENINKYPTKIQDSPIEIWHNVNTTFFRPLTYVTTYFYVPQVYDSIVNHESTLIFIRCLTDILNPLLYDASLVNTFGYITLSNGWISININGYSDNITKIINICLNEIMNLNVNNEIFLTVKKQHIRDLQNYKFNPPNTHINDIYKKNYNNRYAGSIDEKINTTKLLNQSNINNVKSWLFNNTIIRSIVEGNVNKNNALLIGNLFNLNSTISLTNHDNITDICDLKPGVVSIIYEHGLNKNEVNSVILYSFDIGHIIRGVTTNWDMSICYLKLLDQLISDPFFDQLRTKEQLGYHVSSKMMSKDQPYNSLYCYSFLIQSPKQDPAYLKMRIDSFLQNFITQLEKISQTDFLTHINVAISNHTKKDNNMREVFSRNKATVLKNDNIFDFREIYVNTFKTLTLQGLRDFYKKYFINDNTRIARIIGIFGNKHLHKL